MQLFYTDKGKLFECEISVEGSSIENTKARMIFQIEGKTFMFKGNIDESGKCSFDIPALKEYHVKGEGKLTLEVISESTLFEAFTDDIEIKPSKIVEVKLIESKEVTPITEKVKIKILTKEAPIKEVKAEEPKVAKRAIPTTSHKRRVILEKIKSKVNKLTEKDVKFYMPSIEILEFTKLFEKEIKTSELKKYQYCFDSLSKGSIDKLKEFIK